ncbi:hypothetical protein [Paraburkholderia aromaticivorans]|uniref:hypothetical protein n=1 Tax=Paraburkholderia aromaticivorans TaxID=2026199 RepID=UPI001455F188|nr:hypothetical protein [Paraburkholderia aromaticivorans]
MAMAEYGVSAPYAETHFPVTSIDVLLAARRQHALISCNDGRFLQNRGNDVKAVKRKRSSEDVRRFNGSEMELARGVSHIASMLYEQSIHAAVRETLLQFEASHGRDDLKGFADALLRKLEERGKPEAVEMLCGFIKHGRLPEQTPDVPPGPVSIRKPIARKRQLTPSRRGKTRATSSGA